MTRSALLSWLLAFVCLLPTWPTLADEARPDTAQALARRYLAWRGGDAFLRLPALEREGRIEVSGMSGTIRQWLDNQGRQRQDLDLGVIATANGNTTEAGWTRNASSQVEPMQPTQVDAARRGARMDFAAGVQGDSGTVSIQADEALDGRDWSVLRVEQADGEHYDLFLDAGSGALHALRALEDGRTTLIRFEDWREIDGVRHAFVQHVLPATGDASHVRWSAVRAIDAIAAELLAAPTTASRVRFADGTRGSGWLTFEFFRDQRIFIPARVNGHDTIVLLDSGAETSVLDAAFARSIGLTGAGQVTALGTGGTQDASFLRDIDVELGDLRLEGITAVAIDFAQVSAALGHALPVVLGKEILNETVVEVDFRERRIAFHEPDGFQAPDGFRSLPVVTGASGIRQVEIGIEGGAPAQVDFDLGNGSPLLLFPSHWQREGWLADRRVAGAYGGAVGGMREQQVTRVRLLNLAGFEFRDVPTTLTPPGLSAVDSRRSAGNLGLPVLTRFHLIIDYPRDRLLLSPSADLGAPFAHDRSGLVTLRDGDVLKVAYVVPGSAAANVGWQVGDTITAVDGIAIADLDDPIAWRGGTAGTSVLLTLHDGSTRTVDLADYF